MSRTIRTVSAAAMIAAGLGDPAAAELRYDNPSGGHALFYGQFDLGHLSFDDGVSATGTLVDNTNSNSRVGFWLRQPVGSAEFSFNFETGLGFRPSARVSQTFTPDPVDWQRTDIRKVDFAWKTAGAGTFYLGQGSAANDSVADIDQSGTALVTYNSIGDTAGAFVFRTAAGALSARTIGGAFPSFDGGRMGRLRYDTPAFGGVSFSASWGEEVLAQSNDTTTAAAAIRYAGEAGGFRLRGAIGYAVTDLRNGTRRHDTAGSLSALHDSGFSVTLAAGNRQETGTYVYGKLGYLADWFAVGKTALSVDYYAGDDLVSAGSDTASLGIGAVQTFDQARIEAYLGYREYELSEIGTAYRDASSVLFGARWRF